MQKFSSRNILFLAGDLTCLCDCEFAYNNPSRVDLLFTAWIFNLSLALASWKNELLSQGVYLSETRLVRLGACSSRINEKMVLQLRTASSESLALAIVSSQLTSEKSERKYVLSIF